MQSRDVRFATTLRAVKSCSSHIVSLSPSADFGPSTILKEPIGIRVEGIVLPPAQPGIG